MANQDLDMPQPSHVVLEARGVTKSYTRTGLGWLGRAASSHVLKGVTIKVERGEVLAVVGESGSGKTTLGRLLLGLERPDEGVVCFDGENLAEMQRPQLRMFRRAVQMVLQDPTSSLNPRMRIDAILAEPMSAVESVPHRDYANRIAEVLEQVGLAPDARDRYPHQFSGGQRQRIAIARAIIVRPTVLVMDEPVSSLDVSVAAQVLELIETLRTELGMAVLLISHNLGHVWKIAQKVAVMRDGEVIEQGPVRSVFSNPSQDYTRALLDAVPRIAFDNA